MAATPSTSSPPSSLEGKVAIITGGSKGIGKASAIALARLGANVVINYSTDEEAAQAVLAEIQKLGVGEARLVRADASTVDGVQSLVKQTVDAYSKIDVLIPNAGLLPMKDLEHTTEADFDRTFAINVKGPYFLAQVRHYILSGHSTNEVARAFLILILIAGGRPVYGPRFPHHLCFYHPDHRVDCHAGISSLQQYKGCYRTDDSCYQQGPWPERCARQRRRARPNWYGSVLPWKERGAPQDHRKLQPPGTDRYA